MCNPEEFKRVFKCPVRASDALFTVLAKANELGKPRLGLAISVKSAGNAVNRNRVKRAARETFRMTQRELSGIDLVVMARHGITKKTAADMRTSLQILFRSIDKKCARS